jgi:glycosyltransferase involved in cell wall biosynthesis
MTDLSARQANAPARSPIAWVVPGPLRQVTGGYLYDARIVDGLRARDWPVGTTDVRSTRWPLDVPAGHRLLSVLRRGRWGVVVVDELAHPALAAATLGGRLRRAARGSPLVLLVHHLRYSEPSASCVRPVARTVERLAIRAADLVICTSDTTARTVARLARPETPVEVVRPGWDTQVITAASRRTGRDPTPRPPPHCDGEGETYPGCGLTPLSRAPGEGPGVRGLPESTASPELRLLLVGHWTPRKGILAALDGVARAPANVTLDLVGEQDRDPAYAGRVRAALDDPALAGRIRVHGRVSALDLATLYQASDALLLTSTHEGYGMVLAEALAAGLPVIATRVGAVPEVVRDGYEAELVPPGDGDALARAIESLAVNPDERERRSAFARERAESLPRWSDSIAAFESHLKSVLARTSMDT